MEDDEQKEIRVPVEKVAQAIHVYKYPFVVDKNLPEVTVRKNIHRGDFTAEDFTVTVKDYDINRAHKISKEIIGDLNDENESGVREQQQ